MDARARLESTTEAERDHAHRHHRRRGTSSAVSKPGLLMRLWRFWCERTISGRLVEFEEAEAKTLGKQRLKKVDAILAEEDTKRLLMRHLITANSRQLLQEPYEVLRRKYGAGMAEWLLQRANKVGGGAPHLFTNRVDQSTLASTPQNTITTYVDEESLRLRAFDQLANWFKQRGRAANDDVCERMIARVGRLAAAVCAKVKWSLLIEPGRPRTDLSNFFTEFDILEAFFDKVELSSEERAQKAFDSNWMTKARNKKIECVDWSRVKLFVPEDVTKEGASCQGQPLTSRRRVQPSDIFGDPDCPAIQFDGEYGHGDFIHASRVVGGPLINTFILTQAPLPQTIPDFWRMVWQEKSEYIFMLCDAIEMGAQGLMSSATPDHCPVYWPRHEGEERRFGRLLLRNEGLDARVDPLFNVTHLVLWMEDEPERKLRVQHWQWDWSSYNDFHWPFRLLLRSRQSKRPTIVQCMDGCGRSGTLVLIETFLMQLLRGATSQDNPMLTSAVFLRLQRRHAVASHMQYLFAYRTVLHWIQPFVSSRYCRFVLGYSLSNSGFLGKYDKVVSSLTSAPAGAC